MNIEEWTVTSVTVDSVEMLAGHCPAKELTHEAQWMQYTDEESGESCSTFMGAEFTGNTGSKVRVAFEGPPSGIFNVMLTLLNFRGGQGVIGARAAPGSGAHEFTLREPCRFHVTVLVSPVPV